MADSFMMSIVAHRLPCRKGGASGHPPSLADERQPARDLYGHGSTVQSRDLRCLTGFVVLAGVALGALGADVVVGVGDAITAAGAIGAVTMAACGAAVTAAILALTVAGVGVGVVGTCGTGPGAGSFPSRRRAVTRLCWPFSSSVQRSAQAMSRRNRSKKARSCGTRCRAMGGAAPLGGAGVTSHVALSAAVL